MKKRIFFQVHLATFLISLVIGQNVVCRAQSTKSDDSYKSFRLFEDESLLEITLRFDISTYFKTRPKVDYLKANITFHLNKTDSLNKDIRLRTHGVFRNKYCTFPPIELNFKKADFGYTDLNRISKINMVVECSSGNENINYVLKEYLIYKLFNVLTDTSFRVRLLTINYIDTNRKRKPIRQYGFFIEPVEMLAARTNSIHIKARNLNQLSILPNVMDRLAIFNYMIGNYDWSIPGQHNVKVIKAVAVDTLQLGIAIPFDFDWSGMVDAAYAIPEESLGIQSVRERIFRGLCRTKEVYQKDLEIFLKKKEEFYRVINEFPYLNQRVKKDMIGYLDEFFKQLEGNNVIINNLLNSCKKY
jgi:hypothetical protein